MVWYWCGGKGPSSTSPPDVPRSFVPGAVQERRGSLGARSKRPESIRMVKAVGVHVGDGLIAGGGGHQRAKVRRRRLEPGVRGIAHRHDVRADRLLDAPAERPIEGVRVADGFAQDTSGV